MEKFQELREEAWDNFKKADHMLMVTYSLIGDSKLLLNVMDNLFLALSKAMGALLYYDLVFKQIQPFEDNFEGKFKVFKEVVRKHRIEPKYAQLIQEIKETVRLHKISPVEFRKKDRYIICTDNYRLVPITANQLKDYTKKTKEFITIVQLITRQNERIFG